MGFTTPTWSGFAMAFMVISRTRITVLFRGKEVEFLAEK
jgi:hypothetical protein